MPFTPAPTNGDDVLTDTPGSDGFVDALAGNDQITVSGGFDSVDGGADRDRLIINYAGATQAVTTSSGRIWQGNSNFQVDFYNIEDFTVTTGGSNDTIIVYGGDDVVNLGDGDDFADFGSGNDSGDGGTGTDGFSANLSSATSAVGINLVTGVSAPFSNFEYLGTLTTGSGNDTIVTRGIARNEVIDTGAGDDTITVAGGFDNVTGGADRDRLIIDYAGATQAVTTSSGRIWQGNSNFQVDFSGIEDFTVTTGGSNDNIIVYGGDDVVNLGGGDDFVDFGSGNDSGDGGTGNDSFSANLGAATAAISINLVTGGGPFSNFEGLGTLTTGSGDDVIVTRGDLGFFETINTGAGADTITVARGTDTVDGGADRDRLIIDFSGATQGVSNNPALSGSLAAGYSGSISQGNNLFDVDFSGIEDFTVTTGGSNDNITVGDGDDVVNTGGGDDSVNFGSGNDSGDGGTGNDNFSANLGAATAAINVNLVTGGGPFSNFEGLGTLTTGSGDDVIVTRGDIAFFETINTGAGADTITVARGLDTVDGGADRDRLIIDYSGATQAVSTNPALSGSLAVGYSGRISQGNNGYWVDFSGIEDFTVTAGGSNDNITVGDGDDVVNLGGGDDFANFGAGNDGGDGGMGTDGFSANLGSATSAISINLVTGVSATFSNFEYLGTLTTGSGNDTIVTRGNVFAFETINTGTGADAITVALGFDTVDGGADRDRLIINYSGATQSVTTQFALTGSLAAGYSSSINQGNNNYRVDFTGIEDFTVTTGTSNDTITVGDGDDIVNLGTGSDSIQAGGGLDRLVVAYGASATAVTNGAGPTVNGGQGGFDGNFTNGAGNTVSYGSIESFTVTTGSGNDVITTATGDDILTLGSGTDTANSGAGNDLIDGGAGADAMTGGAGDDAYVVDDAGDVVTENAGEGTDEIRVSLASYSIAALGEIENLTGTSNAGQSLTGNSGANTITGADGDDTLDGGGGTDTLVGGLGNDIYLVDGLDDVVTEAASAGTDEIRTDLASYSISAIANVENLTGTSSSGQALTGNGLDNAITGNIGTDTLDGGAGADAMAGGAGDDLYIADDSGDVVTEASGQGTDEVRTALASYSIAAFTNVENLTGTSTTGQALTGNGQANVITGNAGADTLDGGAGADTMAGGAGDDAYVVDDGGDVVTENAGEGTDEIRTGLASFSIAALGQIENLTGISASGQTLTGNGQANVITGNVGADTIDGGAGADAMTGGAGDDRFFVNLAADTVFEASGQGNDRVFASASYTLGAGQSIETLSTTSNAGTGPLNLTGNELGQTIIGNAGANVLTGGGGGDVLIGFGGNDTLVGGAGSSSTLQGGLGNDIYRVFTGSDTIIEVAGEGTDRIYAAVSFVLLAGREIESVFASDPASTAALDLTGNAFGQVLWGNAGANVLIGGGGADYLIGGAGNDILYGNADANSTLQGGTGDDRYYVSRTGDSILEFAGEGNDRVLASINYTLTAGKEIEELSTANLAGTTALNLTGNGFAQTIIGNNGANILGGAGGADNLAGFGGNDILVGGDGDDILNGGADYDILNGGAGADSFVFANPFGPGLADRIQDFVSGLDRILLENDLFTGLPTGALSANAFRTGGAALDADDRILYNPATGQLFFDADGNAAGAAVQFAVLSGAPALAASDFTVI